MDNSATSLDLPVQPNLHRAAFDHTSTVIFLLDPADCTILDANARASQVYGYSAEEFKSLGLSSILDDEGQYSRENAHQHCLCLKSGEHSTFEYRTRRRDGRTVWSEVRLEKVDLSGQVVVVASWYDIDSHRQHRENLTFRSVQAERFHHAMSQLARADQLDLGDALARIGQVEAEALQVKRVSFWFLDAEAACMVCRATFLDGEPQPAPGAVLERARYPRYFAALDTNEALAITNALADERTGELAETYLLPLGIHSVLDVPIWRDGRIAGIVCHEHTGDPRNWTAEEIQFASSVADVVALTLDKVDLTQVQEALVTSEARFRALFEQFPHSIQILSPQGITLQVNHAWEKLFGLKLEDMAGVHLLSDPQLQTQNVIQSLERGLAGEEVEIPVFYFEPHKSIARGEDAPKSNIQSFWAQAYMCPVRERSGELREVILTVRDVSQIHTAEANLHAAHQGLERRVQERSRELAAAYEALHEEHLDRERSEAAARESEALKASMLDAALDGVVTLDHLGRIVEFNPVAEEIFGCSRAGMLGLSFAETLLASDQPDDSWLAMLPSASRAGSSGKKRVQLLGKRSDGSAFPMELALSPILRDAEPLYTAFLRDISEEREAQVALQLAKDEAERQREAAERANQAKSEFLSRMSHELRTPMNSILGFGQLLEEKVAPEQVKNVEYILRAGDHLLRLINEVLDIARIEARSIQISLEPVSLRAVVEETLAIISPLADKADCTVLNRLGGVGEHHILADRQRLMQVLLNLLSNAIKYNRLEGVVTIEALELEGNDIRLSVKDTGIGMTPDQLARLFNPFDRLGAERTGIEGTGLGLALSRGLVEVMGGELGVSSEPGQGSCFWLDLKKVESPHERFLRIREQERPEDSLAEGRRATVLYIEDNLSNVSLVEAILADRKDIQLFTALQGRLGFDLALEHLPDVILLDLHLPDISGDEVLAMLREDERTREIPVLVISADATPGHMKQVLAGGAQAYLTKPLNVREFLQLLNQTLENEMQAPE